MPVGFGFVIKKKRAARGRRSGNHCGRHKRTSRNFRERRGEPRRRSIFAFYSPIEIVREQAGFVKRIRGPFQTSDGYALTVASEPEEGRETWREMNFICTSIARFVIPRLWHLGRSSDKTIGKEKPWAAKPSTVSYLAITSALIVQLQAALEG